MSKNREIYLDEKTGLYLERDVEFIKRDRMTRREWAIWFDLEEIDEDSYIRECRENQYMLNRNLS